MYGLILLNKIHHVHFITMNDQINQYNVYLKNRYVSEVHMKILVKLESREETMNMMRKLLKSHGVLGGIHL